MSPGSTPVGTRIAVALVALGALPTFLLRLHPDAVPVEPATLFFGLGIVSAAFALTWAAEAAERDVPRAFALLVVALLAVLPEYAVDIVFAWKAGRDPSYAPYAIANMTGSNRLLLGLGWPAVAALAWLKRRHRTTALDRDAAVALFYLGLATLYSFVLPAKAGVSLVDSVILVALFVFYGLTTARSEMEQPAPLLGPAAAIGALPARARRVAVVGLFALAALTVGAAAEPFAAGLVQTGRRLGVDEFLLVQWFAPLASEAPEFLVAALLALRGKATAALGLLLSSKVNQWTLLIGSLPIAFSVSGGRPAVLPLDPRQVGEVLLTATQSLFGLGVLARQRLTAGGGLLLAALFLAQLALGGWLRVGLHDREAGTIEVYAFAALYVAMGLWLLARGWRPLTRAVLEVLPFRLGRPPERSGPR